MEEYSVVGKRIPRVDGVIKAAGKADYIEDVRLPGMLQAQVLRSPYPHAKILHIDTNRAERLAGVKGVITGRNIPQIKMGYRGGPYGADRYILAPDKVRYVGDEVAAVAAVDEDVAEEALELIEVEYEELSAVFDPEEAMQPGAPQLHDHVERNILVNIDSTYGDLQKGFAKSDYIFEDRFTTQAQAHCCMELRGWVANFDPTGKLTLWSGAQTPQTQRIYLANLFNMPANKVRLINSCVGGGFGSKGGFGEAPICILLAQRTGKPVKLLLDREEEFTVTGHRYPSILTLKAGVRRDGRLMAWHLRCVLDNGAYYSAANIVIGNLGRQACILYAVPNVRFEGFGVYTNNPWGAGCRGLGRPQSVFALESQVDMIAERLGMDPLELRLRNANQPNTVTCDGRHITTCGLVECIQRSAELAHWKEKRGRGNGRGVGMACLASACGGVKIPPFYTNYAESVVMVDQQGMVNLLVAEPDIGPGSLTVLSQIAAEELGVRIEDVQIATGDTEMVPLASWGTGASRVTFTAGNAVKAAAADAKRQFFAVAADILEANPEDLVAKNRRIYVKGSPEKSISIAEAVGQVHLRTGRPVTGKGVFDDPYSIPVDEKGHGGTSPTHTFAAQVVEVEVDRRTGQVQVLDYVAAHDVGYAINPLGAEGQIEGAAVMGMGFALTEELERERGRTTNPNFMDYRMPTALDAPYVKPILVETLDPRGPFGAKGIAEPGTVPSAPAIANAIYDAVGVRIKDLPITPMKVHKALKEKEAREKGLSYL